MKIYALHCSIQSIIYIHYILYWAVLFYIPHVKEYYLMCTKTMPPYFLLILKQCILKKKLYALGVMQAIILITVFQTECTLKTNNYTWNRFEEGTTGKELVTV